MVEYFVLISVPSIFAILGDISKNKKTKKFMYLVCFFVLIFLTASRVNLGADYKNYQRAYKYQNGSNIFRNFDFAFALLMRFASIIKLNFNGFLFLCSLINFIFLYKAFSYYDKDHISFLLITYLLYFDLFIYSLSAMRQFFTISIHLYALRYIENKKFLKYLFFSIIGGLFHWSGFVLILLYFVYRYLMNKGLKQNFCFLIFIAFLYFGLTKLFELIKPYLSYKITYYFFIKDDENIKGNLYIELFVLLMIFMIYFLTLKVKKIEFKNLKIFLNKEKKLIPISVISIGIFLMLKLLQNIQYQNILPRFQMYFYCQLPIFLNYFRNKYFRKNYILTIGIVLGLIILFYFKVQSNYLYYGNMTYNLVWMFK